MFRLFQQNRFFRVSLCECTFLKIQMIPRDFAEKKLDYKRDNCSV